MIDMIIAILHWLEDHYRILGLLLVVFGLISIPLVGPEPDGMYDGCLLILPIFGLVYLLSPTNPRDWH